MVGLPQHFLDVAAGMPVPKVREILRKHIFEIENSVAMYQTLENLFAEDGQGPSFFKTRWRTVLDGLRTRLDRPLALLALTPEKHALIRASEFGIEGDGPLSDARVLKLSGFDRLFGPDEFLAHLKEHGGECGYALYVRASDPIDKLRHPASVVEHPLLNYPDLRRIIKANSLTLNIDDPAWGIRDNRRLNDTKRYLPHMGMAHAISSESDLFSPEFSNYLYSQSVDREPAEVRLRCKPAAAAYGCYGHLTGNLQDRKFLEVLRRNMRQRGVYVVQPELAIPQITNAHDGRSYVYIDRCFFATVDGEPIFLGGARNMIPQDSVEAQEGRIHGNHLAVYGQIIA
jgi:hypothetical protein